MLWENEVVRPWLEADSHMIENKHEKRDAAQRVYVVPPR